MKRINNIEALRNWVKKNGAWNNRHTIYKCMNCHKSFSGAPSAKAKFCSKDCYYQNMRERSGKITPNWKGGKSSNNKCLDCQRIISYASTRCSKCSAKLMPQLHIKDRPWFRDPKIIKKALKRHSISSLEIKFQKIVDRHNLPYKYVGNGDFFIERKNPDFININGEKKAIEVYARIHKEKMRNINIDEWKKERQQIFAKYGWEIIFFDEVQLTEENVVSLLKGDH